MSQPERAYPLVARRRALGWPQRWTLQRATHVSHAWAYRGGAIVVSLALAALALNEIGHGSPLAQTFQTTFGTAFGMQQFVILASPLVLTGAAVAVARRVGLWNVGGNGQLFAGAWAATGAAYGLPHLPGALLVFVMACAAVAGGAAWALAPALMRAFLGISEVITTLMLNFVAVLWTSYWVVGPWRDPASQGGALISRPIPVSSWLPTIDFGGGWTISVGILIALGVVTALGLFFRSSLVGYRSGIIGASERAGFYAGMSVRRYVVGVLLLSGGLAGLAGMIELTADVHSFSPELSNNTGYIGIAIGVLGGASFLAVGLVGIVVAAVFALNQSAQFAGVPPESVFVVVGSMLLLTTVADVAARYRVVRRRAADAPASAAEVAP